MNDQKPLHPTDSDLEKFLQSGCDREEFNRTLKHLFTCEVCSERLWNIYAERKKRVQGLGEFVSFTLSQVGKDLIGLKEESQEDGPELFSVGSMIKAVKATSELDALTFKVIGIPDGHHLTRCRRCLVRIYAALQILMPKMPEEDKAAAGRLAEFFKKQATRPEQETENTGADEESEENHPRSFCN